MELARNLFIQGQMDYRKTLSQGITCILCVTICRPFGLVEIKGIQLNYLLFLPKRFYMHSVYMHVYKKKLENKAKIP